MAKQALPYILGTPMRRMRPLRFQAWTWSPGKRHSRHVSVAVYEVDGRLRARIWLLGNSPFAAESPVDSVQAGARWADKKLRGLLRALGVVES